eukprot:PITA_20560
MKITLELDAKTTKQRPYQLNPKYKEKVHQEWDKMLDVGIIEPIEESDWIAPEDRSKTTFTIEWGFFEYTDMPFRLKNAPTIISRVVITVFKEFIHKFLEVYFDDWTMFGLVKPHVASQCLMLDTYRRYHTMLNLKKCILCVPFGIFVGHVICKKGLMVDPAKIIIILNLEAPRNAKQMRTTLGHTGYYRKFIKAYA